MGLDRSLDQEGIPDLEGPLPGKVATGDPQEGASPPTDRPASTDYGVTADEQSRPEPLDDRIARERPDTEELGASPEAGVLVEPEDEALGLVDDEKEMVARAAEDELTALSAEEAAVHIVDEP
jgi:hypothetical protein